MSLDIILRKYGNCFRMIVCTYVHVCDMLNTYPTLYCACMYTLPSNNQLSSLLGVKRMESHDFSLDIKYVPKLQPFQQKLCFQRRVITLLVSQTVKKLKSLIDSIILGTYNLGMHDKVQYVHIPNICTAKETAYLVLDSLTILFHFSKLLKEKPLIISTLFSLCRFLYI